MGFWCYQHWFGRPNELGNYGWFGCSYLIYQVSLAVLLVGPINWATTRWSAQIAGGQTPHGCGMLNFPPKCKIWDFYDPGSPHCARDAEFFSKMQDFGKIRVDFGVIFNRIME
jgi:hypothetical protein